MLTKYNDQRWAVGVSGGPDSMALLEMLVKANVDVVVVHVNYHVRDSANRDERIVENYCEKHHLKLYIKEVNEKHDSNFEAWAREIRYDFYKEIIQKEDLVGVMLAHHKDDFLETAILRERQNRQCFLGIKASGHVLDIFVVRPLLHFYKDALIEYCLKNQVEYGIDETNEDLRYSRNAIRHELKAWSVEEKNQAYDDYQAKNIIFMLREAELNIIYNRLVDDDALDLNLFKKIEEKRDVLRLFLTKIDASMHDLSSSFYEDLEIFVDSESSKTKEVHDYLLVKEYGYLRCVQKQQGYSYVLESLKDFKCPYCKIETSGEHLKSEGLFVDDLDFPLRIRNVLDGDEIEFAFGHKNIKKLLREKKYKYEEIEMWPVIENNDKKVIFVVGIGADTIHFTNIHNLFVVK